MESKFTKLKMLISGIGALFMGKMGEVPQSLSILVLMMIIDQISGILAAKKEALEHPKEINYGISSKRMVLGIFKKVGYILTILVATVADLLMGIILEYIGVESTLKTSFCILVIVWFILEEAISILENVGRMGVKMPQFLEKTLFELRNQINNKK